LRSWAAAPIQFEVSAFFLFVMRVTMWGTKQPTAAQEGLFDYCGGQTCKFYASIWPAQYVDDLLISRGTEYLSFLRSMQKEGEQTTWACFFRGMGVSPFHNHLRLACAGQTTPPGATPPLCIGSPGIIESMSRPDAMKIQHMNYIAPFVRILNTVLAGDADFRSLPLPELNTRLESALDEAAKWAVPE
jgi:hypothetical protein